MKRRPGHVRSVLALLCAMLITVLCMQSAHAAIDSAAHSLGLPHEADSLATPVHLVGHADAQSAGDPAPQTDVGLDGTEGDDPDGPAPHNHDSPSSVWLSPVSAAFTAVATAAPAHVLADSSGPGLASAPLDHPPKTSLDTIA